MSIVMTGGGTGGHLAIIAAVKDHLKDEKLIYIGSNNGQDRGWFEDDDDFEERHFLNTRGVVNQGLFGKVKSIFMVIKATYKALKLLKKYKAKVVFSVGGFSSAPTSFASMILQIPLVIHEQNAAIGRLNSILKPYANAFISSYLESSPINAYPIKEKFFKNSYIRESVETIIFLGGSQGAKAINTLALEMAPELQKRGIKIIHQAGVKNVDEVKKEYISLGIDAVVFGFTTKLAEYMKEADFAIARSGASTLWELSASAIPSYYVPYPYAASDHQYHNAKFLTSKSLAWVQREEGLEKDKVLLYLDADLKSMSQGLMEMVQKDGSRKIADYLNKF